MVFPASVEGWLTLVGGVSGIAVLLYCLAMIYFARERKRADDEGKAERAAMRAELASLKADVCEVRGILLGLRAIKRD